MDPVLRRQFERRLRHNRDLFLVSDRMVSVTLDQISLTAFYAPAYQSPGERQFKLFIRLLKQHRNSLTHNPQNRWKLCIAGGDMNVTIVEDRGWNSGSAGRRLPNHTPTPGKRLDAWWKYAIDTNTKHINSHFEGVPTFASGSEPDHMYCGGRHIDSVTNFGNFKACLTGDAAIISSSDTNDIAGQDTTSDSNNNNSTTTISQAKTVAGGPANTPRRPGPESSTKSGPSSRTNKIVMKSDDFDHLGVFVEILAPTYTESTAPKTINKSLPEKIPEATFRQINSDVASAIHKNNKSSNPIPTLAILNETLGKWAKTLVRKAAVDDALEGFSELNTESRGASRIWKRIKLVKQKTSGRKVGITAAQGAKRFQQTSNDPLHPLLDILPSVLAEFRKTNPSAPDDYIGSEWAFDKQTVADLSSPIKMSELDQALKKLKGSVTPDYSGLTVKAVCICLNTANKDQLLGGLNEMLLSPGRLAGHDTNMVRTSSLHKKGPDDDPSNYRFLSISGVWTKLMASILTQRLALAAESESLLDPLQFGFRKGLGVFESLLLGNRAKENSTLYDEPDAFMSIIILMVDLFRAFPSADRRILNYCAEKLGILGSNFWDTIISSHRDAQYLFPPTSKSDRPATVKLTHGLKEGDPSSPLLFILTFTLAMKRFKTCLADAEASATPQNKPGIRIRAPRAIIADMKERLDALLFPIEEGRAKLLQTTVHYILTADDTTLLEQMKENLAAAIPENSVCKPVFDKTITECGLRENKSKLVAKKLAAADDRNLGDYWCSKRDVRQKCGRAAGAVKNLSAYTSGAKMDRHTRIHVYSACVRSCLLQNTQVKSYADKQMRTLRSCDARLTREFTGYKKWQMKKNNISDHDIDLIYERLPFVPLLMFHRARTFGHNLRRPYDSVLRMALLGEILPELTQAPTEIKKDVAKHPVRNNSDDPPSAINNPAGASIPSKTHNTNSNSSSHNSLMHNNDSTTATNESNSPSSTNPCRDTTDKDMLKSVCEDRVKVNDNNYLLYYPATEAGRKSRTRSGHTELGILKDNILFFEADNIPIEMIDSISKPFPEGNVTNLQARTRGSDSLNLSLVIPHTDSLSAIFYRLESVLQTLRF